MNEGQVIKIKRLKTKKMIALIMACVLIFSMAAMSAYAQNAQSAQSGTYQLMFFYLNQKEFAPIQSVTINVNAGDSIGAQMPTPPALMTGADPGCLSDGNDGQWFIMNTETMIDSSYTPTADTIFMPKEHKVVTDATGDAVYVNTDPTYHWKKCSACEQTTLQSKALHDTDGPDGACSVCGYKPDVQHSCDTSDLTSFDFHPYVDATCANEGNLAYHECKTCGKIYYDQDPSATTATGINVVLGSVSVTEVTIPTNSNHDWNYTSVDAESHQKECKNGCGTTETEKHSFKDGVCEQCGYSSVTPTQSAQPTASPSSAPTATPSTQPTASPSTQPTATPTSHEKCDTSDLTSFNFHPFAEATCAKEGNLAYHECKTCGKIYYDLDVNTTTATGINTVLGAVDVSDTILPKTSDHDWNYTSIDAENHQKECKNGCGTTETEKHSFKDGVCEQCGYSSVTPTQSAQPTASPSSAPTATPSSAPTATPSSAPTATPSTQPTATPTASPSASPSTPPGHAHLGNLQEVSAKAADCTHDGNKHYYRCTVCDKYFEDAMANVEIKNKADVIIKAGHKPVAIPGKDATCKETGLTVGEKCSVCNTILKQQTVIPKTAHSYSTAYEKDANGHYRVCTVCKEKTEVEKHISNGPATYQNPETCKVCGYEMSPKLVSSAPKPTNAPTKAPDVTDEPAPTKAPDVTGEPAPTKAPDVTDEPAPTKAPDVTDEPAPTKAPDVTDEPAPTKAPDVTDEPTPTKAPDVTDEPTPTKAPDVTDEPVPSKAPDATDKPEPTQHVHHLKFVAGVDPTAYQQGNKAYYICEDCNMLFEDKDGKIVIENAESLVIPALGDADKTEGSGNAPKSTEKAGSSGSTASGGKTTDGNTKTTASPKTDDHSNAALYTVLLVISAVGLVGFAGRKKFIKSR